MIRVEMSKDVRRIKDKFFLFFSLRETGYFALGFITVMIVKNVFFPEMDILSSGMTGITILCMLPYVILGWVKIYKIPILKFLSTNLKIILAPKRRIYDNGLKEPKVPRKTVKSKKKGLKMIR